MSEKASPMISEISVSDRPPRSRLMGPIITLRICRSMNDSVPASVSRITTHHW